MPATTTKAEQLARNRRNVAAYRARNPERARESTRMALARMRGNPNYKCQPQIRPPSKDEVRANMIRARFAYLKAKLAPTQ